MNKAITLAAFTLVAVVMGMSAFAPAAMAGGIEGPVTICHIPPGNPDNLQTITVDANSLSAHLAHGDFIGTCERS